MVFISGYVTLHKNWQENSITEQNRYKIDLKSPIDKLISLRE